ncbi:MAG: hypothetical protein GF307_02300 [candidate division Zixibacteria bacterium]|nr:hypothetical protein [candidate division Zixibacteria bacterium]
MYYAKNENKIKLISAIITVIILPLVYFAVKNQTPFVFLRQMAEESSRWITIMRPEPPPEPPDVRDELLRRLESLKQRTQQALLERMERLTEEFQKNPERIQIDNRPQFALQQDRLRDAIDRVGSGKRANSKIRSGGIDFTPGGNYNFGNSSQGGSFSGKREGVARKDVNAVTPGDMNWAEFGDVNLDDDISSDYDRLLQWVKNHPKSLPNVFINLMEGERTDPQTIIRHKHADIYLLINDRAKLVNIAVVNSDSVAVMIDHGLALEIRKLDLGEVFRRNEDSIIGLDVNPAQTRRSLYEPWYTAFRSWWEGIR